MSDVKANEAEPREDESVEIEFFDPWAEKLAFDKVRHPPRMPDHSHDLAGTDL